MSSILHDFPLEALDHQMVKQILVDAQGVMGANVKDAIDDIDKQLRCAIVPKHPASEEDVSEAIIKAMKNAEPILESDFFIKNEENPTLYKCTVEKGIDSKIDRDDLAKHDITPIHLKALMPLAEMMHASGNFAQATEILRFLLLAHNGDLIGSTDGRIQWGLLCNSILAKQFDNCVEMIDDLERILERDFERLQVKSYNAFFGKQRLLIWTMLACFEGNFHWRLVKLIFRHSKGLRQSDMRNILECQSPKLIRYVSIAAMLFKDEAQRGGVARNPVRTEVIKMIERNPDHLIDPFSNLARAMWIDGDIKKAIELLPAFDRMVENDLVLCHATNISEEVRTALVGRFIKTHKNIPINFVAQLTGKSVEDAETLIPEVNRNSRGVVAKIDSAVAMEIIVEPTSKDTIVDKTLKTFSTARRRVFWGTGGGPGAYTKKKWTNYKNEEKRQ